MKKRKDKKISAGESPTEKLPSLHIADDDKNKRDFKLRKRKAAVTRERLDKEERSREVFERKKDTASDKKAPLTSRTRGYYRFSKDYPSNVDENRFRENLKYGEKSLRRHAIIAALCCILAFCIGFIPARTAMLISSAPADSAKPTGEKQTEEAPALRGMLISYDELKNGDVTAITEKLSISGCNTAVFEFKNDGGYCIFNTGAFIGASADRRIANAYDTVNAVKAAGFSTAAYISCFLDSCAPVSDYTYAVRSGSAEGGAWRDNSSRCWLNPYSDTAKSYLYSVISAAADGGFSRIILGNVCFPTDSGESEAFFDGESTSVYDRNEILRGFIASAVTSAKNASVTVICDMNAINPSENNGLGGTNGSLLGSAAGSVCVDARASHAADKVTIGDKTVTGARSMPYVLVSETARYTKACIIENDAQSTEKVFLMIDGGKSLDDERTAVSLAKADGFIIWS